MLNLRLNNRVGSLVLPSDPAYSKNASNNASDKIIALSKMLGCYSWAAHMSLLTRMLTGAA